MPGLFHDWNFPSVWLSMSPALPRPVVKLLPLGSLVLVLTTQSALHAADKPAAPAQTPPAAAPGTPAKAPAVDPVLELPKIQVTGQRAKQIDKEIKRLDKLIVREKNKIKPTDLDKTLNNEKVATVAAIFGGNSADHMSAVAASRVMLLEQERDVFEAMKRPTTLEDLKMMEAQVEELRTTRRNLDDAAKQR
jgi:hypothetical protein